MSRKKQLGKERKIEEERLIQIKEQAQHLKRKFVGAAAGLAVFLTLGYALVDSPLSRKQRRNHEKTEITFAENKSPDEFLQQARTNANLRQAYLDNLVSRNEMPYSSGIVYDEDGAKGRAYLENLLREHNVPENKIGSFSKKLVSDGNFDARVHEIIYFKGKGIKPPIFVGKVLFANSWYTSKEIKHILKYHEARHTELFSRGYRELGYLDDDTINKEFKNEKITQRVLYDVGELDAITSELNAIESGKSEVSKATYEEGLSDYRKIRKALMKTKLNSSPIQAELINKVLTVNPDR